MAIHPSLSPPILHCDISAFDPTKLAESLHEYSYLKPINRRINRAKEPNGWQLRGLLRRATIGHAAAQPSPAMNSRRLMPSLPKGWLP